MGRISRTSFGGIIYAQRPFTSIDCGDEEVDILPLAWQMFRELVTYDDSKGSKDTLFLGIVFCKRDPSDAGVG